MTPDQRQVNRLFEAVCRTSHELISELDADGVITFVTDAAVDVLGAQPSELLGVNVFSIIHPDDQARTAAILSHCISHQTDWMEVRLRIVHPSGAVVWVETSGVAHLDEGGRVVGFSATSRRLDAEEVRSEARSLVRERIELVIRNRLIRVRWQPIFSLQSGGIAGVEALSRFAYGPALAPSEWFADAFEVGLGLELEFVAVETALMSAVGFPPEVYVSVNVSPTTGQSCRSAGTTESWLARAPS